MSSRILWFPVFLLVLPGLAAAVLFAAPLDQAAIHSEYLEGNFDAVIRGLEIFQVENPVHSREDSLFTAKYLAVVHAADPKSVEAGKYWMHRLLLLSPTADLSGMYVSEEIERIFARVRKEARAGGSGRRKWLWIGAGGTALAAAVTAWMVMGSGSDGPEKTVVPVQL